MVNNVRQLPLEIERGITLFNQGEYFRAHEVLEHAWRNTGDEVRQLYQGLVQVSVMFYHLERGNVKGAYKLLCKATENLTPFSELSTKLDIPRLLSDLANLAVQIQNIEANNPVNMQTHLFRLHLRNELSANC